MQRIIQRYIFDIQREAEVTEGMHFIIFFSVDSHVLTKWRHVDVAKSRFTEQILFLCRTK